jgi:hypothetical protein
VLHPAQGSREATLSSDKEASLDVAVHRAKEGVEGGKKRCKQWPQVTMTDHNDGNNGEAGGSSVRCILTTTHNDKWQARLLTDHFKSLLGEACPNHVYPVSLKLKDCGMRRSFMTSGSLT